MSITIQCSMVKYTNSRRIQYSCKGVCEILSKLGWDHKIVPPATMILDFQKTFPDKGSALQGRRDLDHHLRIYHRHLPGCYRIDSIKEG